MPDPALNDFAPLPPRPGETAATPPAIATRFTWPARLETKTAAPEGAAVVVSTGGPGQPQVGFWQKPAGLQRQPARLAALQSASLPQPF